MVVALVARATTYLFRNILFSLTKDIKFILHFLQKGSWKRAIPDAEISDNRNVPQVGYDQALYPRLHYIFDFLCFFSS